MCVYSSLSLSLSLSVMPSWRRRWLDLMKAPYIIVVAMALALLLPLQQAASVEIDDFKDTEILSQVYIAIETIRS
jgi:DMSO/TMAO reductase YedYZ heme-binding membrane subunit